MKPRLLDLFCGAGGCSVGYARAGFDVVGVDLHPQPNYPYEFIQADAITWLRDATIGWAPASAGVAMDGSTRTLGCYVIEDFDVIHASPPCQAYSGMSDCRPGLAETYDDLIARTRELLIATGLPYVIENVPRSPLIDPIWLCGRMFGLDLYRHRGFESNVPLEAPPHPEHTVPASKAGHWQPGTVMSVAGHVAPIAEARRAMGIEWTNRAELGEAVPPAYTEHIGHHLMAHVLAASPVSRVTSPGGGKA